MNQFTLEKDEILLKDFEGRLQERIDDFAKCEQELTSKLVKNLQGAKSINERLSVLHQWNYDKMCQQHHVADVYSVLRSVEKIEGRLQVHYDLLSEEELQERIDRAMRECAESISQSRLSQMQGMTVKPRG